jgi:hypothetical protein
MKVIDLDKLNRLSGWSSDRLQSSAVVTEYQAVSDLSRSCLLSSVVSVLLTFDFLAPCADCEDGGFRLRLGRAAISVVSCIDVRLRLAAHTSVRAAS